MEKPKPQHLLVLPLPAQGHLIPLLDLAHHLTLLHPCLTLTIVSTPSNLPLLLPFLSSTPSASPLLLPLPSSSPSDHVRTLPSPSSVAAFIHSLSLLLPDLLLWSKSQHFPPSALLADFFLPWSNRLAADLAIPLLTFYSSGAFLVSLLDLLWRDLPLPTDAPIPFPSLPSSPSFPYSHLPSLYRRYTASAGDVVWEFLRESMVADSSAAAIINTFDALEAPYLEHLRKQAAKRRVFAVGPVKPTSPEARGGSTDVAAGEIFRWLDGCPARSVVYVCFGSQFTPGPAQARALAAALEVSGVKFVWCVGGGVVPEGFEERMEGKGMVIKGWVPQVVVLSHGAVGAFLTHCGWNSVLEGMAAGVVLVAWPIEADQFVNARLLVEEVKVAVMGWGGGAEEAPEPEALGRVLAESLSEGSWRETRERAAEMRRKMAEAVGEGGSSWRDMEMLVKQIGELG